MGIINKGGGAAAEWELLLDGPTAPGNLSAGFLWTDEVNGIKQGDCFRFELDSSEHFAGSTFLDNILKVRFRQANDTEYTNMNQQKTTHRAIGADFNGIVAVNSASRIGNAWNTDSFELGRFSINSEESSLVTGYIWFTLNKSNTGLNKLHAHASVQCLDRFYAGDHSTIVQVSGHASGLSRLDVDPTYGIKGMRFFCSQNPSHGRFRLWKRT